jgi:hypothetical protein
MLFQGWIISLKTAPPSPGAISHGEKRRKTNLEEKGRIRELDFKEASYI